MELALRRGKSLRGSSASVHRDSGDGIVIGGAARATSKLHWKQQRNHKFENAERTVLPRSSSLESQNFPGSQV